MIKIHQLTKTFGDRTVFSDYALIGNSGCRKTTLLNMVAKLEPYDQGSIQYKGKDLRKIKPTNYFRNELGYLFQNFGLIDNKTVSENLDLGLIGHKLDKQKKRETKEEVLDRVGLSYIQLDQKVYELSGGEAQRVALAKIILKDPPLILADELTAALDPETSQEIMDLLLTLKNKERLIIIATHNPTIWKQADQVVSLKISQ